MRRQVRAPGEALNGPLVAVVDRDDTFLDLVDDLLIDEGYRTLRCPTSTGAQERIRAARPALIILDLWLERPELGWQLLGDLRRDQRTAMIPVLICSTSVPLPENLPIPAHWPPTATLPEPFKLDDLLGQIRALVRSEAPSGMAQVAHSGQIPAA